MKIELDGPWSLRLRGNKWTLDIMNLTVYEIDGVGPAKEAAQAAALWLKYSAEDVAKVAAAMPYEAPDDEDED